MLGRTMYCNLQVFVTVNASDDMGMWRLDDVAHASFSESQSNQVFH